MKVFASLIAASAAQDLLTSLDKANRYVRRLEDWREEWIGTEGKLGTYGKLEKVTRRIENTGDAFRKNVLLCNPELASTEVGEESFIVRNSCSGENCSLINSYKNIQKMEQLIDESIQCDGDIGRSLDIRREGLRRRITKLRRIVVNSVCKLIHEEDDNTCDALPTDVFEKYDAVLQIMAQQSTSSA
ncbi:Oidioi.mRNA.OKI2018_I69.PAR.g11093.t1.cds [Oikopleura dioica]|uniref:Oidioi.mRNA.OKI2018_I69.PAR.g11093.t1.cds n=1 Tax=Oikopleura dioica TaxID=34765 RepID=A0ABN7RZV1_OIKDI|nr:Oidioi.mRNA.OKI2018_I69.PAR.g11093.t1.cds [Oikopleura dioica]